jgi:hypothetical protein
LRRLATSILKRVVPEEIVAQDTQWQPVDAWRNICDDLKQIKLAQLLSPNGTVWQVTEPGPEALNRLKSVRWNRWHSHNLGRVHLFWVSLAVKEDVAWNWCQG